MNQMVENLRTDALSPDALALKNWKFDQEVSREAMVNFVVLQELCRCPDPGARIPTSKCCVFPRPRW